MGRFRGGSDGGARGVVDGVGRPRGGRASGARWRDRPNRDSRRRATPTRRKRRRRGIRGTRRCRRRGIRGGSGRGCGRRCSGCGSRGSRGSRGSDGFAGGAHDACKGVECAAAFRRGGFADIGAVGGRGRGGGSAVVDEVGREESPERLVRGDGRVEHGREDAERLEEARERQTPAWVRSHEERAGRKKKKKRARTSGGKDGALPGDESNVREDDGASALRAARTTGCPRALLASVLSHWTHPFLGSPPVEAEAIAKISVVWVSETSRSGQLTRRNLKPENAAAGAGEEATSGQGEEHSLMCCTCVPGPPGSPPRRPVRGLDRACDVVAVGAGPALAPAPRVPEDALSSGARPSRVRL